MKFPGLDWPMTYSWAISATNWLMSHVLFLFVVVNTIYVEKIYLLEFLVERTHLSTEGEELLRRPFPFQLCN